MITITVISAVTAAPVHRARIARPAAPPRRRRARRPAARGRARRRVRALVPRARPRAVEFRRAGTSPSITQHSAGHRNAQSHTNCLLRQQRSG